MGFFFFETTTTIIAKIIIIASLSEMESANLKGWYLVLGVVGKDFFYHNGCQV